MKRYTFFTDDYPVVTCEHCYEDQNENYTGPAIDRLAEYEATGLIPAEVDALLYQLKHIRRELDDATNHLVDLRMQQRWIPVTERLPKERDSIFKKFYGTNKWTSAMFQTTSDDVLVVVSYKDGSKSVKTMRTLDGEWRIADGRPWNVTHWMPLPEPPKEE